MIYRKLDANDDFVMGSGSDFLQNTPEAVKQAILTRLRLWVGEWFVDTSDGTDWSPGVLGKLSKLRNPDAIIQGRILDTTGVSGIAAYSSTFNSATRRLTVEATIDTIYGTITISETL